MKQFPFSILFALVSCVPVSVPSSEEPIIYEDRDYSSKTGIVKLHPVLITTGFPNPIISIGNTLKLNFDLLEEEFQYLKLKIYHCDWDWNASPLQSLEFLDEYNELPVNDYTFSQSSYLPYVNYQIDLPKVKISGNYVLVVFDEMGKPLFSRRFMVFESKAGIDAQVTRSTAVSERNTHHQLEFDVRYAGVNVSNPALDIKAIILQNHNWRHSIRNLTPTSIRIDQQLLEYKHFSQENTLAGWNEFRFFDTRSISFRGQQVQSLGINNEMPQATIEVQGPRTGQAYSEPFEPDLNGNFILENRDPNKVDIQSEYLRVFFTLKSGPIDGKVYVIGKFNNWNLTKKNQLVYDTHRKAYTGAVLLKQGFYNYMFYVEGDGNLPFYSLEGSHFQTKNDYEILIYFREPGKVYDRLIGYERFSNP